MVDISENYGIPKGIKFNCNKQKTRFVSGKCPLHNPHLILNQETIYTQPELKHLGFRWSINKLSSNIFVNFM